MTDRDELPTRARPPAPHGYADRSAGQKTSWFSSAESLRDGKSINLQGFGTFEPVERAAREGRNPKTGETITVPAKRAAKFKPAQALKDL